MRPRKKKYQGLPPFLYFDQSQKLYRYRHPNNGKWHYFGSDKTKAVSAAIQLNSILLPGQDLVAKVLNTSSTLENYISNHFQKNILQEKDLAKSTLYDYSQKFKFINKALGHLPINSITVKDISTFLAEFPPTQSNRYRSLLSLIFKHSVAEGICSDNPAECTLNRKIVKQRQRLTLNDFSVIYELAEPWLKNTMDLALLTLQRREDIANMKFSDIKDGYLYVIQKKTEKHGQAAFIKIRIGENLNKLILRCKDKINSNYLIHRLPERVTWKTKSKATTQVTPDYITKAFAAIRDETHLFDHLEPRQKPTFHEIRSLGIKLYEDNGIDAQSLAGHTTRAMTENYKSGHENQWTEADACLSLPWFTK